MRAGQVKQRGRPRKYKRCPECGRKLVLANDFYRWQYNGRPRESRICKDCTRERARLRRERIKADPYLAERDRDAQRQRQRRDRDRNAARCKAYRERLKAEDPQKYQQQLEDMRIRSKLRRDGGAKPLRTVRRPLPEARAVRVDVGPLVKFLEDNNHIDRGRRSADARNVYRVLFEVERVTLDVADRILTRYGGSLATVYPEVYA